jgi:cell division septation protein DedD
MSAASNSAGFSTSQQLIEVAGCLKSGEQISSPSCSKPSCHEEENNMTEPETIKRKTSSSGAAKPQQPAVGAAETAKNVVNDATQSASEIASQLVDKAKSAMGTRLTSRTSKSAVQVSNLAGALRQAQGQLEGDFAGPYLSKAADGLERFSSLLETSDAREMARNAEEFARKQPLLFLGGAFAAGVMASRFLKSSAIRTPNESFTPGASNVETVREAGEWQP